MRGGTIFAEAKMAKVMAEDRCVDIPMWVTDLGAFRRWVHSDDFPEQGRISFINGEVLADLSMEELFSHNQVKFALDLGLGGLIRSEKLGMYMPDGMLMTNDRGGVGNEPDAIVVLNATLASHRVRFTAGKKRGAQATELVGTPDIVVEIISPSSEDKDCEWLMSAYWNSGIPEYWLIDARGADIRFDIYKSSSKGYALTRKADGWSKSAVLGRQFRLVRQLNAANVTDYELEVR